jgi:hypothetical protein
MGTSSPNGGQKGTTPLVPSWLDDSGSASPPAANPPAAPATNPQQPPANGQPAAPQTARSLAAVAVPAAGVANRFSAARAGMTRFARSGGTDRRSLGKALSSYVSQSNRGARTAARRMGSSRTAATGLVNFLNQAATQGTREALRSLNLESLAGQPIEQVFAGLADYICPPGGSIDEGIARDAFIETIADLAGAGITDIDQLTGDQIQTVFELYATHAIEARICNDVATSIVTMPANVRAAERVQEQLRDFIRRSVSDAVAASPDRIATLTPDRVNDFVGAIYQSSFEFIQVLADAEADQ